MGNRCGHNPASLRFTDQVKRGRGGHPQVIQIASAYVKKSALKRDRLSSWHGMNESGRRRRTEIREAMQVTVEHLLSSEFNIESRRCAKKGQTYTKAPDLDLIARQISKTAPWRLGVKLSVARVRAVIRDFVACGYVTLGKQQRRRLAGGEWVSSPKVITFTKKFFLELGGKKLWRSIAAAGRQRTEQIKAKFAHLAPALVAAKVAEHFEIKQIFSPRQLSQLGHSHR